MAVAEPAAPGAVRATRPSLWTKLAYGFGSVAYGVKDNGFSFFLLLFYSQVIGLDATMVGLALTIALVFDAISDPIVGYWSDNFHSKWGRRHPFMYAAAVPVAASYFLIWSPPAGLSEQALFWYLLGLAIFIRVSLTFYETPSSALAPELTQDYDQRSSLISWRYFFAWTGGNSMSVAIFLFIFPAFVTATITNGQFNREAYVSYGVLASFLIFVSIMISALGTHSRIRHLKPPPPKRNLTLGKIFGEMFETLANRSFIALFLATVFASIAAGLAAALSFYFTTYFWKFTSEQTGIIVLGVFLSAIIGAAMAPVVTKAMGKKGGAMFIGFIAVTGAPLPIILRLLGILPDDPQFTFWFVFVAGTIDVALIICFQILFTAMIADLVEEAELKTGRRSEGVFFAAVTFVRKAVTGLGVMAASFVLAMANFPKGVAPADVDPGAVTRLGLWYVPTILVLWWIMMAIISTYRLDRAGHEDNLRQLAEKRGV